MYVYLQFGRVVAWTATLFMWIASVLTVFLYFDWNGIAYPSYDSSIYYSYLDGRYPSLSPRKLVVARSEH